MRLTVITTPTALLNERNGAVKPRTWMQPVRALASDCNLVTSDGFFFKCNTQSSNNGSITGHRVTVVGSINRSRFIATG